MDAAILDLLRTILDYLFVLCIFTNELLCGTWRSSHCRTFTCATSCWRVTVMLFVRYSNAILKYFTYVCQQESYRMTMCRNQNYKTTQNKSTMRYSDETSLSTHVSPPLFLSKSLHLYLSPPLSLPPPPLSLSPPLFSVKQMHLPFLSFLVMLSTWKLIWKI